MNLQQLEYIVAVDQFKNFSKAAEYCYITQATLSTMIKKLEEELDIVIFDRKSNPIITTDEGQIIVDQAVKVLQETYRLKELAQKELEHFTGTIKIGIIPTIANSLLPVVLLPILEKFPDLHIEMSEVTTDNIIRKLKEGTIDMGILATPLDIDDYEEEILYYETLMVYGKFDEDTHFVIPDEIKNHRVWLLEEGNCLRNQFINLCSLKKSQNMPSNLEFDAHSFETLLNMVDQLGGLTLIPELYFQSLTEERKKKVRNFSAPVPVREVSIVYYRPFAKRKVIEALAKEIKALIQPILMAKEFKNSELEIVKI
ncbi:MAG TPA: LysR substrate-binding domain-containing protein [Bacteroidales bacterium]|nr:LysR substrate-binding domain-containing protein [Bacteroidales bacterium]HOH23095.1 LysR substrate-binding domain-containing protein [Bacteroidales bacterium]HPB57990.1 LysR substrate-binding domain-containing protein [Bacteroidales bacterium]HPZ04336.1 LysR substrate-binding domain-containing protein [Bacteroidales bacterium]HQB75795.1 LysR substrate-binding domain-containing protein [Bacteroidales bacterium]